MTLLICLYHHFCDAWLCTIRDLNRYKLIFAYIDIDGNGTIDAEELTTVLKRFKIDASKEKVAEMFAEADEDDDYGIDFGGKRALQFQSSNRNQT